MRWVRFSIILHHIRVWVQWRQLNDALQDATKDVFDGSCILSVCLPLLIVAETLIIRSRFSLYFPDVNNGWR